VLPIDGTRAAASAATVGVPGPRGVRGSSIEVERTSCAGQRRTRLAESLIITSSERWQNWRPRSHSGSEYRWCTQDRYPGWSNGRRASGLAHSGVRHVKPSNDTRATRGGDGIHTLQVGPSSHDPRSSTRYRSADSSRWCHVKHSFAVLRLTIAAAVVVFNLAHELGRRYRYRD